jgi:hypothetical protein
LPSQDLEQIPVWHHLLEKHKGGMNLLLEYSKWEKNKIERDTRYREARTDHIVFQIKFPAITNLKQMA